MRRHRTRREARKLRQDLLGLALILVSLGIWAGWIWIAINHS